MSDEAIIRKLIADGNGSNEDRRLLNLFSYINTLEENPDDKTALTKIEIALAQAELSFNKHIIVADTCIKGSEQIREFMSQVESDINTLRDRIERVKEELVEAKLVRKNKQEYDALAKLINGKPSRVESAVSLEKIESEINELRDQQLELEQKLKDKRKNMYALAVLLSDLDATMEADQPPQEQLQVEEGEEFDSDTEQKSK